MDASGLPFSLRVSLVIHNDDPLECADLPLGLWLPPRRRSCYSRLDSTGWYVWDPGLYGAPRMHPSPAPGMLRLRHLESGERLRLRLYRAATMFWDPYAHNYVHIPLDCTTTDVDDTESGAAWRRPGFGICQAPGGDDIAVIGHSEEHKQLHLPGPDAWFEKLLPITLQPPDDAQSPIGRRYCRLAGDLDILIGLIAFSTTFEHSASAIDCLFRPEATTTTFNPLRSSGLPDDDRKCPLRPTERQC